MDEFRYVADLSFGQFLARTTVTHPDFAKMIDPEKTQDIRTYLQSMNQESWEFEDRGDGGRGAEYNVAQKACDNRREGMTRLLSLFSASGPDLPDERCIILDALAGDGTLFRFAETLPIHPTVISADLSAYMIERCMEQDLPCIRQSAAFSLLQDGVLDGVLIAYGSHHLNALERRQAASEAWRMLKPGGRFVLHDFEIGGAVDAWFRDVVHPFSRTGHPHPHFSRGEMENLLDWAAFRDGKVIELDDPFTISAPTAVEARLGMLRHLYNMYGLVKLPLDHPGDFDELERRVVDTLGMMQITPESDGTWLARLSRAALVAVGTK